MFNSTSERRGVTLFDFLLYGSAVVILFCGLFWVMRPSIPSETREVRALLEQGRQRPLSESELLKIESLLEQMRSKGETSNFYWAANRIAAEHYYENFKNSLSSLPEPERTLSKGVYDYLHWQTPRDVKKQHEVWLGYIKKQAASFADFQAHPERYTLSLESPETVALLLNQETVVLGQKLSGQFKVLTLSTEDFHRLMKQPGSQSEAQPKPLSHR